MRVALASLLVIWGSFAYAQSTPFDMSPEKPDVPAPALEPAVEPEKSAPVAKPAETAFRRYLIPYPELSLSGEYSRQAWSIYLTPSEAGAKTTLHISYQNAIVVAPESSKLSISVNGVELMQIPIQSPDRSSDLVFDVPAALLRGGQNEVVTQAVQRHRTDCTIESTHELWTRFQPSGTFLSFEVSAKDRWDHVEDIRAIGVDAGGKTRFNLIVPAMDQAQATEPMMRLGETLALMAGMPDQSFFVTKAGATAGASGKANILIGTDTELEGMVSALPVSSHSAPTTALIDDPVLGQSLLITGPTWQAIDTAIDGLSHQVDRPVGSPRQTLGTQSWQMPDTPLLQGETSLTFAQLGQATLEFSGRRLRTGFSIGVPSDFYAYGYGEAQIMLDAAYSEEALPGSHIDVYVNDNIAATVPIISSGGEILRHLPIKVTMRHFRPGDNKIELEAILKTPADAVCAPGATALDQERFVLFDTSEFVMPNFARIAQTPNLAATGGTGFPYSRTEYPLPLVIDRAQPEALAAALTILARLSTSAGRLIPVDTSVSVAAVADRNALFIGAISQIPSTVLTEVGVGTESQTGWGEMVASVQTDTDKTFGEWRERLRGRGWRGRVSVFEDWMNRTFNVSTDSFQLFRGQPAPFVPDARDSLMVAQDTSPLGLGIWTVVTAPSTNVLGTSVDALVARSNWRQLGGRITTFDASSDKIRNVPTAQTTFVDTQPFSLSNYRLIAANWLSVNAPAYALGLTVMSIILGLATAALLATLGRRR